MASVALEVLNADDWRRWRAVRLSALKEAPDAFHTRYADWVDAPEQRYRDRIAAVPYNVVAVEGGRDVGLAAATMPDPSRVSELRSLWVAPSARGQGVAEALIAAVAAWARAQEATQLSLGVRTGNARAIALYERLGFSDAGARAAEDRPPERTMTLPLWGRGLLP